MAADQVIFDENTIIDRATFSVPHQFSAGVESFTVNGEVVAEGGRHRGTRRGVALRKQPSQDFEHNPKT